MTRTDADVALPVRVKFAEGAAITSREPGHEEVRLSESNVNQAFQSGMQRAPRADRRQPDISAGVTLTGDAQFLVGKVDLGVELGMDVLRRGLDAALAVADGDGPRPAGDEAHDGPRFILGDDARLFVMNIEEAAKQWQELRPRVELWDRVVLTENGRRVALIVAWDWWTLQRHSRASLEGAYWGHWHTGEFNASGYAWDVMRLLEPRDARTKSPASEARVKDDDGEPDEQPD